MLFDIVCFFFEHIWHVSVVQNDFFLFCWVKYLPCVFTIIGCNCGPHDLCAEIEPYVADSDYCSEISFSQFFG